MKFLLGVLFLCFSLGLKWARAMTLFVCLFALQNVKNRIGCSVRKLDMSTYLAPQTETGVQERLMEYKNCTVKQL